MTNTALTFYPQLTGSRGSVTNVCQHVISLPLPPDPPLPHPPLPILRIGIICLVNGVHLSDFSDDLYVVTQDEEVVSCPNSRQC